jgi:hypothetical protein
MGHTRQAKEIIALYPLFRFVNVNDCVPLPELNDLKSGQGHAIVHVHEAGRKIFSLSLMRMVYG